MLDASENRYHRASQWLAQQPGWEPLITVIGPCRHEAKPEREPYEALIRAIAYQQLTAKAGNAILRRLCIAFQTEFSAFPSPQQLLDAENEVLRACGFSLRKAQTLRAVAAGALTGLVPSRQDAVSMSDEELIARLTALKGIGRWTVEMLLIYTLERMDIMPLNDFGIIEGLHYLHAPQTRLRPSELKQVSSYYAPYRTIASWYLWRIPQLPDYQVFKNGRVATRK